MYIVDGIAYAGEQKPPLKVCGVRAMPEYRLWVRFNTGETKAADLSPLLSTPAFARLRDEAAFRSVYIDYGVPVWLDGEVDLDPEYLYHHGISC